ncbi:MAG: DMT family transporter [Brasilonema sp.]
MTNTLQLQQKKLNKVLALGAIASLSIGLIAISFAANFIKLSEYELSPNSTIFNRLWIASVVLGLWKGLMTIRDQLSQHKFRQPKSYTPQDVGLLLGFGAFFAFSQLFWAWSLTQTSVAISTVLHNLTPMFTSLGAWLLFGRHYDCKFGVGMVIAIAGVTAIGLEDLQITSGKNTGDVAAVLSAVLVAMYVLVAEQLRTKLTATTILLWGSSVAAFVTFPVLLFTHDQFFPSSWKGWLSVIALALICQVLGQGLIAHSLSRLTSGFVATAFLLDPVLSSIEAWVIFSEQLSLSNWLAFITVLMGVYLAVSSQSIVKPTEEF